MDFSTAPSSVTVGQSSSSTSVKEADNALLLPKVQAELVSTCPPPINKESLISVSPFPIHSGYIVREKIGQGTWGSVHLATQRSSGLDRAVKKIPKRFTSELALFRQEITFLKAMDHPNIVRLYETFEDYANIYMVMEYCRGGELFDYLITSKYFSEAAAAKIMRQILSTLCYIHSKNIAHRDLKPENFLFLSTSIDAPMKLIDFGLAKRFSSRRNLKTRVGTLYYVSPQVLNGSYNERCDVWSAGVILHLLLTGTPPFNGPDDATIVAQVREGKPRFSEPIWRKLSPLAKELVERMLCKDQEKRLSASDALCHPWFTSFSPHRLAFYRSVSVPADLMSLDFGPTTDKKLSFGALSERGGVPENRCCKLSVFGAHSPLCAHMTRPPLFSDSRCVISVDTKDTVSPIWGEPVVVPPTDAPVPAPVNTSRASTTCAAIPKHSSYNDCRDAIAGNCGSSQPAFSSCIEKEVASKPLPLVLPSSTLLCRAAEELCLWRRLASRLVVKWTAYALRNQLERTALRVVVHQMVDDETFEPQRSLFNMFDTDNDGVLKSSDLITAGRTLEHFALSLRRSACVRQLPNSPQRFTDASLQQQQQQQHPSSASAAQDDALGGYTHTDTTAPSLRSFVEDTTTREPDHEQSSRSSESTVHSLSFIKGGECPTENAPRTPVVTTAEKHRYSVNSEAEQLTLLHCCSGGDDECHWEQLGHELASLLSRVALDGGDVLEYTNFLAATLDTEQYLTDPLLKASFRVFDRDGDGIISAAELRATLGWADIYSMPRQLASSAIYPATSSKPVLLTIDEELKRIFRVCDADQDGNINYHDFVASLRRPIEVPYSL